MASNNSMQEWLFYEFTTAFQICEIVFRVHFINGSHFKCFWKNPTASKRVSTKFGREFSVSQIIWKFGIKFQHQISGRGVAMPELSIFREAHYLTDETSNIKTN